MSRAPRRRGADDEPDLPHVALKNPAAEGPSLDRVLVELAAAEAAGATDVLGGGVYPGTIAPYTSVGTHAIRDRCVVLAERGLLERVCGLDPEQGVARHSYVVRDETDVPDEDAWGAYGGEQA